MERLEAVARQKVPKADPSQLARNLYPAFDSKYGIESKDFQIYYD